MEIITNNFIYAAEKGNTRGTKQRVYLYINNVDALNC